MSKQNELQEEIVDKTLKFFEKNHIGHLNLAMRFGKCKTAIEFLKKRYYKGFKEEIHTVIIAYPDNKLKDVWIDEFKKWGYTNTQVYLTNFSSLEKYKLRFCTVFIIDEWHSLSEKEMEIAKEISEGASVTLGLSGTISKGTQDRWPEFTEIANYSTLEGISDGILSDYKITVHIVELDTKTKTLNKKGKLVTEKQKYDAYTWIIEKNKREGRDFKFLALARNRLSLSSIGKMEYLKSLLERLKDKRVLVFTGLADVADNIGIPSYHSKSKSNINFLAFQNGHINRLALAAMGKVGVTYPSLDSVILVNFVYNSEETAQILNRAIKLDYKDKIADLHILCLNENPELKKIKKSLEMLDKTKIRYI